jgi:hypothetical protein
MFDTIADLASAGMIPNGKYYSIGHQTQLNPKSYKGVSRRTTLSRSERSATQGD